MSGPILNLTLLTKSTAHTLRALSLASFFPGFLILLVQGIASHRTLPALGILPLFLSSAYSALLLANQKKCGCQSSGLTGTPVHLISDALLGVGLLVLLILSWIDMPRNYYGGMVMLGTYGTNFLILNLLVHVYFTTQMLLEAGAPGASYPSACPHCQYGPFTAAVGKTRGAYEPLLNGEGRPRGSADEERGQDGESAV